MQRKIRGNLKDPANRALVRKPHTSYLKLTARYCYFQDLFSTVYYYLRAISFIIRGNAGSKSSNQTEIC
jgi:hypothetical protein